MVKTFITLFCILLSLALYCCMVQGKKEDEMINRLFLEKQKSEQGKDEE